MRRPVFSDYLSVVYGYAKMKFLIKGTLETLEKEGITDVQARWEFLKYEITSKWGYEINSKTKYTNYIENSEYIDCRNKLDEIYEQKINGIRIRSKCYWYEYGEKFSKLFINLEKSRAAQNTIRNVTKDEKNLACHKMINQKLIFRKS